MKIQCMYQLLELEASQRCENSDRALKLSLMTSNMSPKKQAERHENLMVWRQMLQSVFLVTGTIVDNKQNQKNIHYKET